MSPITEQLLSLTEDQKLGLIVALSQQVAYPTSCKPLGYHVDRLPSELEQQIDAMAGDEKRRLIKAIVNHHF
jgi:hypothetical protein